MVSPYRLKFLPEALAIDKREDLAAYRSAIERLLAGK